MAECCCSRPPSNAHGSSNFPKALELINTGERIEREEIVRALGVFDDPRARAALGPLLSREGIDATERMTAALSMAQRGDPRGLQHILDAVQRLGTGEDAFDLIMALGEVGSRTHLTMLQRIVETDAQNRLSAVVAALAIIARG